MSNPQGIKQPKSENGAKFFSPSLLFSGMFVAISFIVSLIPLALFTVAQVAAMLGKKVALLLLVSVALVFFVFGFVFSSQSMFMYATLVIMALPFFMLAVAIREKQKHWIYALAVFLIPFATLFGALVTGPKLEKVQVEQIIASNLKSMEDDINRSKSDENFATNKLALENYKQIFESFQSSEFYSSLLEFFSYNFEQRVAFFVYGAGASYLFLALLIVFANVIFVDLGFEQVERLRAVVLYTKRQPGTFPSQLTSFLFSLPMVKANRLSTSLEITRHSLLESLVAQNDLANGNSPKKSILSFLWKPLRMKKTIYCQGYAFQYEGKSPWSLRDFSLPLPIALLSVAILAAFAFSYGGVESLIAAFATSRFAILYAGLSLAAFAAMTIVALQGMFITYRRVSAPFVIIVAVAFLLLSSKLSFGPFTILAVFGAVGLLDYVYDWRGKKVN